MSPPTTLFDEWHSHCGESLRCTECKGEGHIPDFDEDGACSFVCPACDGCGCECGENPEDEDRLAMVRALLAQRSTGNGTR